MIYGVITELPADPRGNSAMVANELWWDPQGEGGSYDDPLVPLHEKVGAGMLYIQAPVFRLGEVMYLNEDGRELYGQGRKPSKWSVQYETFSSATEACARSIDILREADG